MVEVVKYGSEHKAAWDAFVASSRNGTFLLHRDYMEYHADRFTDHSLLFYRKDLLIALLPANEVGQEVHSHGGLTYGGIISDSRMKASVMLEVFEAMKVYFKDQGFRRMLYKAIPHIYHQVPAEEDLYALFRYNARLYRRDVSSVVELLQAVGYDRDRRWRLSRISNAGIELRQSDDFSTFMEMERALLMEKYNKLPVHTAAEMMHLAASFPEQIKLYGAYEAGEMHAGIIIYETKTVAHCQYTASTAYGRSISALDALTDYLITKAYPHKKYFDFGISTEQQGQHLNKGLVRNKESYGARTVVHDFYELQF
ncbi:GNAT family N-acetyltransferase [Pontibacter diazotrophicus]|uniref:GNAT family N-acetyltransferase n=1 Tax=Pontibacter diazotrophicus TaxID=1400979 RepID=A0A3D8L8S4_9BACT|nr:GNAT family N-acetyltransferase [Pontibacter diazotrophicus]RDV13805.1 GNAT family N-acetyltransferase [Pontibacter diazotrophicus]